MYTEEEKKERARESHRRWRERNRERTREYGRKYYREHREEEAIRAKRRVLTPEQVERRKKYNRERQRKNYAENREAILEKKRGHRKPEKEYARDYWKKNRERLLEKKRKHRREHPEYYHLFDAAKNAVVDAIADGTLKRPDKCEKCGCKGIIEAHHYKGYAEQHRLDVQWLCKSCHRIADAKDGYSKQRCIVS